MSKKESNQMSTQESMQMSKQMQTQSRFKFCVALGNVDSCGKSESAAEPTLELIAPVVTPDRAFSGTCAAATEGTRVGDICAARLAAANSAAFKSLAPSRLVKSSNSVSVSGGLLPVSADGVLATLAALACAAKAKFASPTAFLRTSAGKICRSEGFFSSASAPSRGNLVGDWGTSPPGSMAAASSSVKASADAITAGSCPSFVRGVGAAAVGVETKMAMI